MSQKQTYPIHCPECQADFEADLYESLNLADAPELKEELIQNRINQVSCPQCNVEFRIDKRLLYHDPGQRLMIYLFPGEVEEADQVEDEFLTLVTDLNRSLPPDVGPPQVHLVLSRVELVERIFMAENGLEPRVVEYAKHMVYTKNLEKMPFRTHVMLLNAQDSDEENLNFVVLESGTGKVIGITQFPRKAYQSLMEMFEEDDRMGDLLELFPGPYFSARRALLAEEEDPYLDQG